jgi:threonine dehydrogenase-like Zn-dependent dehydrogenase
VALEELAPGWEEQQGLTAKLRTVMPAGADAVIDYVPSGPSVVQAAAAMAMGGTLVHMGGNPSPLAVPIALVMQKCWKVVGTRACTRTDTAEVLGLLASGELQAEELVTHRFALRDVNSALDNMMERPEPMWMSVVRPQA